MLSFKQAQKVVLNNVRPWGTRKILLEESLGYVLAKDIFSPLDIPQFDNSAMDGYAVRAADIPGKLKIVEEIPAGYFPRKRIEKGEAALIMTGSVVPQGADTVVMVEDTRKIQTSKSKAQNKSKIQNPKFQAVEVLRGGEKGKNIRRKGEVVRRGQVLLKKGALIRPPEIALLATVNIDKVAVYQKPEVAVLSTGNEVVPLGGKIQPGKVVDSNRYGIMAQLENAGFEVINDLGIAKDDEKELEKKVREGIVNTDILITIGGVSVGEWDLLKKVVSRLGRIIFWKANVRPGGPITFGKISGKLWFGLPGNPVASLLAFEQFVCPALLKMSGRTDCLKPTFGAVLENEYRGHAGKLRLERADIHYRQGKYSARLVRSLGSADLRSLTSANGIIFVPEMVSYLHPGQKVLAQFF